MKIYQLKTAKEFIEYFKEHPLNQVELMHMYAAYVSKKFAAECVNEALGNKMEVSNALHNEISNKYDSIIWDNEG